MQPRNLRFKLRDFTLYRLCRTVVDNHVRRLSSVPTFDDMLLMTRVCEAIDDMRMEPKKMHDQMLAMADHVYRDLKHNNPSAQDEELRLATLLTGTMMALCLNCCEQTDVRVTSQWLSKGMQHYGDVMRCMQSVMEEVTDEDIDSLMAWINKYWDSEDVMFDDDGEFVMPYTPADTKKTFDTITATEKPLPLRLKRLLLPYVQGNFTKGVLWISMYRALTDMKIIDLNQAEFGRLMENTFAGEEKATNVKQSLSFKLKGEATSGYLNHAFVMWKNMPSYDLDNHDLIDLTEKIITTVKKFLEEDEK